MKNTRIIRVRIVRVGNPNLHTYHKIKRTYYVGMYLFIYLVNSEDGGIDKNIKEVV